MIFLFHNLETVRIALTSGQIPPDVSREPVEVAFNGEGQASIKPHAIPPKAMQNALKRLGIKTGQAHHGEPMTLASWPQILPVARTSGPPEFTPTTPVLFELPVERFSSLVTEMLRLGNDRQSFRLVNGDKETDQRVLLRVVGPPYYTLLRALDRLNADVAAYMEQAPRVWIEIGCTHPLATLSKVPDGQVLLLRAPREWKTIADGPFQDVYEVLDFQLPKSPIAFAEGKLKGKLTVPLRLAAGNAAEVPEMWVLKDNAIRIFDAFVRDADDRLANRLMFAVAENGDRGPLIVLRTRTSKLTPPAIELDGALGYVPFRRLNNLFLPIGTRLQPTLRRDAVRKMLAEDDAQTVWLTSLGEGRFVPESLPDAAFRPLADWVEYVIDHQRQPLQDWMQATGFQFDDFVCKDEAPIDRPRPPGKPKSRKPGERPDKIDADETTKASEAKGMNKAKDDDAYVAPPNSVKLNELKIRRTQLEQDFLAIEGPPDAPARLALWPQLAQIIAALGDNAEAAICWLNGFWELDDVPMEGARAWFQAELQSDSTAYDFARTLQNPNPAQAEIRAFAAYLIWCCTRSELPAAVRKSMPSIRTFLESHGNLIPIRALWLVWRCLAKVGGDVLGLARVRDRILESLFSNGLDVERDVPRFIRIGNQSDTGRLREILERTSRIRDALTTWVSLETEKATTTNRAYIHLMFAFGYAMLRERNACAESLRNAGVALSAITNSAGEKDEAHALLLAAFQFRIEQALAGQPHRGKLSDNWHKAFEDYAKRMSEIANGSDPRRTSPYIVERFRQQSWILEPEEKLNPYRSQTQTANDLNKEISALALMHDPVSVAKKIKRLLFDNKNLKLSPESRVEVAVDVLPFCPRAGAEFTREILGQVVPLIEQTFDAKGKPISDSPFLPESQAKLLERSLVLAVSYDASVLVKRFTELFGKLIEIESNDSLFKVINLTASQCIRSLRRIGLRDDTHALLVRMDAVVKQRAAKDKASFGSMRSFVDSLCARLHVAGAWMYFGDMNQALATLDEVREFLATNSPFKPTPWHSEYAMLARAYVSAVSQGPIAFALDRIEEMFKKLAKVANTFTSASHYSRLHLGIVEEVVFCLMQPESMLGEIARRWRDDDEYLVRRRIHDEMRKLLAQSGL
jgi:hypothetical protein